MRAACTWFRCYAGKDPVDATELAAVAFRDSHALWSPALRTAFGNLIGRPFDAAVLPGDTEVTLRGPLRWMVGDVIADAAACVPWIGLPANGLRTLSILESRARGVLIIENKSNFERVCAIPDVADQWLCVWGRGYVRNGLLALIRAMSPPHVVGWGDLDAHGIAIIADLARRLERQVRPVGMDPELFRHAVKRVRTATERQEADNWRPAWRSTHLNPFARSQRSSRKPAIAVSRRRSAPKLRRAGARCSKPSNVVIPLSELLRVPAAWPRPRHGSA
jgi:hypothetical protein